MKNAINWTVGRRLAAIAAIGAITTILVGAFAISGMHTLQGDTAVVARYEDARTLMHALDTRSSELKVDALKAVAYKDNSKLPNDVTDDTATVDDLMKKLTVLHIPSSKLDMTAFAASWTTYEKKISDFVNGAVANQSAAREHVQDVQAANDQMDQMLGSSITSMEKDAAAERAAVKASRAHTIRMIGILGVLGVAVLWGLSWAITRSLVPPLKACIAALQRLADGEIGHQLPEKSTGCVGLLEKAFNSSIESVRSIVTTPDTAGAETTRSWRPDWGTVTPT